MARTKKGLSKTNADKPETERLLTWIDELRRKRSKCRRKRRRDLRIEAVLTCALSKAKNDLRIRRLSAASKWQKFKKQCLKKKVNYTNYKLYNGEDTENPGSSKQNPREEPSCPELGSLDDVASKLAEIKVTLQG